MNAITRLSPGVPPGAQTVTVPLPSPPVRQFSFTDFSTNNPTAQQPGNNLDAEYDRGNNATTQLINFFGVTFNTDGTLKPGSVGQAQLAPGIEDGIVTDVTNEIQPLVNNCSAWAQSADLSATNAAESERVAGVYADYSAISSSQAGGFANTAFQASNAAQLAALNAGNSQTAAANSANGALGNANLCIDYGLVCQAWAEHMPDTIPPNILAVMGITGDHWSSRWWANQAGEIVQDADNNLNEIGQGWVDQINDAGSANQGAMEDQFHSYMSQLQSLYLGAFYYPPTTDGLGNPVATGALYYNLALEAPYVWNGTAWVPFLTVGPAQVFKYLYVATAGQTVFSGADRNGNSLVFNAANKETITVFHSKLLLTPTDDYSSGVNEVTLHAPAAAGDIVQIWIDSVPVISLDWQTVKIDTSIWTTTGGPLRDMSGNSVVPAAGTDIFISINGVWQNSSVDYLVTSSNIAFTPPFEPDAHTFAVAIVPTQAQIGAPSAVTAINTSSWVFDGVATQFNLVDAGNNPIAPTSAAGVLFSLNGVWQAADVDYAIAGSTIIFTTPPEPDAKAFGVAGLP